MVKIATERTFVSPLFALWQEQYVALILEGRLPGEQIALTLDGEPLAFQYTGKRADGGAEVMVRLGFDDGQRRRIEVSDAKSHTGSLTEHMIAEAGSAEIGEGSCRLTIPEATVADGGVTGPLSAVGAFRVDSRIQCATPLTGRKLIRINDGPLFADYALNYEFAGHSHYRVRFRCFRSQPFVEVHEEFRMGYDAALRLVLNPDHRLDRILSHSTQDFEADAPPIDRPLGGAYAADIVCRIQVPMIGDNFIPNNRNWFMLHEGSRPDAGMVGLFGLYGERWRNPVANMIQVRYQDGDVVAQSSLEFGDRYWLLYAGPFESEMPSDRPYLFNGLQAQFNTLPLADSLEIDGATLYDRGCWDKPGFFDIDYRERAMRNVVALPSLSRFLDVTPTSRSVDAGACRFPSLPIQAILTGDRDLQQRLVDDFLAQGRKWVHQFQGYREGVSDYAKTAIGFPRRVRVMLLDYEILRKGGFLTDEQAAEMQAYFVFAAHRLMDERRWPHSRTMLHPDHPESSRDFYAYPGEHKPDKLLWTNCLPNFQSDQNCALMHLAGMLPDHPDAPTWRRLSIDDVERQLAAYCRQSGAWEESINYALGSFYQFVITFRVAKRRLGVDYFNDERMRRFAGWMCRFVGPYDKRFDAYTYPGIGNSVLPQNNVESLLAYAGELPDGDSLKADLTAVYLAMEPRIEPRESTPLLLAVSELPDRGCVIRPLESEHMDDLGVALRHAHPSPSQSYLFQKIGFWKDHYEADESAFNWYAKGTPFCMDYGTYSGDAGVAASHNLVEIPDADPLRRGYLADKYFTPAIDYTASEIPVTLKLSHGHLRSFEEIDGPPQASMYFYIGDENPVGPKTWKTRLMFFVKPDYLVLFDRVIGATPHRYNLHVTADAIERTGGALFAKGRFDLDLHGFVQHPARFRFETGELAPAPARFGQGADNPHRQAYCRLYNDDDGIYRTLLFAAERGRDVAITRLGEGGIRIETAEYTDFVWLGDTFIDESTADSRFVGRSAWVRRYASGEIAACAPNVERMEAFGMDFNGRGPWRYNTAGDGALVVDGVPRPILLQWQTADPA